MLIFQTLTKLLVLQSLSLKKDIYGAVVPTDKTNSFRVMEVDEYTKQVLKHLETNGKEIPRSRLTEVEEQAHNLITQIQDNLTENEADFLIQNLKSKAIPSPKLLIKDHKKADNKGNYPTRLVVPANNFTSGFPRMGYLGIKKILDDNGINYMRKTIIQASDLKEKIETMDITNSNSTIISIDAEAFYPSVKLKLVRKAVHYFTTELPEEDQIKIDDCLEMVKFGMNSTLLTFIDKYYEYDGDQDPEDKGLTIGGYESAWLADLVGAYILANTRQHFEKAIFDGLYRDDGFAIMEGKWTYNQIVNWRNGFQKSVNELAGGDYLQFTCSLWLDESINKMKPTRIMDEKVSIEKGKTFPYLDMELFWSPEQELQFRVHLKPNQELKYLNKGSTHTNACFRAIPSGVFGRLAKLTTVKLDNMDKTMEELYPKHIEVLRKAELITGPTPTLKQVLSHTEPKRLIDKREARQKERERKRAVFFCVGFSQAWTTPIHEIIRRNKIRFGLSWIRTKMSYHRFTNLREIFQGDLSHKLTLDVESKDFQTLECNCRLGSEKKCGYNNLCRRSIVVYKVECLRTNKIYIGNTQQHFKTRMQQHFGDVKKLLKTDEKSDSYAKHFAHQLINFKDPSNKLQRNNIHCSIIWQGNPISAVKTFGTANCTLCNKERLEILKLNSQGTNLIY